MFMHLYSAPPQTCTATFVLCAATFGFYTSAGDSNLGPRAPTADTSLTQPKNLFVFCEMAKIRNESTGFGVYILGSNPGPIT